MPLVGILKLHSISWCTAFMNNTFWSTIQHNVIGLINVWLTNMNMLTVIIVNTNGGYRIQ